MLKLLIKETPDEIVKENFRRVAESLNSDVISSGNWRFIELTFTAAVTGFLYKHNMPFTPKDIIQTSKTGAGSVTFNYASFDETNINITTTGACVVRFFLGRMET